MLDKNFALSVLAKLINDTKSGKLKWEKPSSYEIGTYSMSHIVLSIAKFLKGNPDSSIVNTNGAYYKTVIHENITLRVYQDFNESGCNLTYEYSGSGFEETLLDKGSSDVIEETYRLFNIVASLHDKFIKSLNIKDNLERYISET